MRTGICSISYRKFSAREVIDLAVRAGLDGIEWGGDVHVPPGDEKIALDTARMTAEAGLACTSYGSYYRLGVNDRESFSKVLDSAQALGVDIVRIWAGNVESDACGPELFAEYAGQTRHICAQGEALGIKVAFEYHGGTMTHTPESALRLVNAVGHSNLYLYWQPNQFKDLSYNLDSLNQALPYVTNAHVFYWIGKEHYPLEQGIGEWKQYARILKAAGDRDYLLEFTPGDDPEQTVRDARTLKEILSV